MAKYGVDSAIELGIRNIGWRKERSQSRTADRGVHPSVPAAVKPLDGLEVMRTIAEPLLVPADDLFV